MDKSIFLFFSGTAGAGKNTVIDNLIERNGNNFVFLNSHTSRAKREDDSKAGRYNYVTFDEFEKLINEDKILEYDMINNQYYGISKEEIAKQGKANKVVLKDLSVKGVMNCKELFKETYPIVGIFLTNSKKTLKERLINRNYPKDQIKSRLKLYKSEQSKMPFYDFIIYNEDLETTLFQCEAIINHIQNNKQLNIGSTPQVVTEKLVDKCEKRLRKGKKLTPISAFAYNNELYIKEGANEFLAHLRMKKEFPIYLVSAPKNFQPNNDYQIEWEKLVGLFN